MWCPVWYTGLMSRTVPLAPALALALALSACSSSTPSPAADAGPPDAPSLTDGTADRGADASPDRGCPATDARGGGLDAGPGPLAALKKSILPLMSGWRFATDPGDKGKTAGWAAPSFDDSKWATIAAGKTWEAQGYPGYDGVGWYRQKVTVPASWTGAPITFVASGVDDEYDLYINGTLVAHHGDKKVRSVWQAKTETRIDKHLSPGKPSIIAVRVNDWGAGGGLWRRVELRYALPLMPYQTFLPSPVLPALPDWVALYWAAWRMAWHKVAFGDKANGLAAAYMDEGFNEQIYQWDSSFITLFGRYGRRLLPVMAPLANFYGKQRADGYIQRVYSETDGKELGTPTAAEPMVNPPLFAWVEWEYYRFSGDASRLKAVLPRLEKYYAWLEKNTRGVLGKGLYYQTDLGSGMDNMPRGDVKQAGWADASMQQCLAAKHMADMAQKLGDKTRAAYWTDKHEALAKLINKLVWNDGEAFYYDLKRDGLHSGVKHIGAFWALLSHVADDGRAKKLVANLKDPKHFARPHRFPVLSAADPNYDKKGHYWRGSVWAPTNYMTIRGLRRRGFGELAGLAAANHVDMMARVFKAPPLDASKIAPEERDGDYATIWECYAPEAAAPATRWDNKFYSRQDFVGWSGLGPIALLIEEVIGLEVIGAENKIVWDLRRADRHGLQRMPLGLHNLVDLVAEARASTAAPATVTVKALRPFSLQVMTPGGKTHSFEVCAGSSTLTVPGA